MEGQSYAPIIVVLTAEVTSGSGHSDLYTVPAGYWLEEATGIIIEALDAGTVDFGQDGAASSLIANNEWTETTKGQIACSRKTTAQAGLYFDAVDLLRVTFGGACTEGKVMFILKLWDLNSIIAQGVHAAVEV
jgi:hypothetical protein